MDPQPQPKTATAERPHHKKISTKFQDPFIACLTWGCCVAPKCRTGSFVMWSLRNNGPGPQLKIHGVLANMCPDLFGVSHFLADSSPKEGRGSVTPHVGIQLISKQWLFTANLQLIHDIVTYLGNDITTIWQWCHYYLHPKLVVLLWSVMCARYYLRGVPDTDKPPAHKLQPELLERGPRPYQHEDKVLSKGGLMLRAMEVMTL